MLKPQRQVKLEIDELIEKVWFGKTVPDHNSIAEIMSGLFAEQTAFIIDRSKNKAAVCGRRAGKTYSACAYLTIEALTGPDLLCGYIALTRKNAKLLLWPELKRFDQKHNLGMRFNESDLIAYLPNDSRIILSGAEHVDEIEKFRGLKFKIVVIDEAGSFKPHINELIEEVLEPTLIDLKGTIALIGTPNAACVGYFHTATTTGTDWRTFHWTILNNPHIGHAAEYLEKKKKEKRWEIDNPIYQREWLGRWIRSEDSIVYRFRRGDNEISGLPDGNFSYVLGIDYGFVDASAFVVIAFSEDSPNCYIVHCEQKSGMIPTQIADRTKELSEQFKFVQIVGDSGGLGKPIIEETNERHRLDIKAAEKRDKYDFIELMNDDFITKKILVTDDCEEYKAEAMLLQWDEDRKKEQEGYANHLTDAALYAWREAKHWIYEEPDIVPEHGSKEWFKFEEDRMIEELETVSGESEFWWAE